MPANRDLPILELADRDAWEQWLHANHSSSKGVWLKIAKKGAPTPTVTRPEALEEALRYGWIDGQAGKLDDFYWLQRYTPRTSRSKWSQINRDKALQLIKEKRMHPAGLAQVQAAKRDGRWDDAYEPQSRASVPDDFQAALDANPPAREFFATLKSSQRYSFLYRIKDAKRPQTRARRIAQYVDMLARGDTIHRD